MATRHHFNPPLFATLFVSLHICFALYAVYISFGPVSLDGMHYTTPILFYIPASSLILDGITLLLHIPESIPTSQDHYSHCRRMSKCLKMMYFMNILHILFTWIGYSDITSQSSLMESLSVSWSQDIQLEADPHPLNHIQSSLACCGFWNPSDRPWLSHPFTKEEMMDPLTVELTQLSMEVERAECDELPGCAERMMYIMNARWHHLKWALIACRCASVLILMLYLLATRRDKFIDGILHIAIKTKSIRFYSRLFYFPVSGWITLWRPESLESTQSCMNVDIFIIDPVPEYKANNDLEFDEPPPYYHT